MNKAVSKLILSLSGKGGCHCTRYRAVLGFSGVWTAINSSCRSLANWASWSRLQCGCWTRTWFLWFQIDQVIITNSSRFFFFCWIHKTSSLKSTNTVPLRQSHRVTSDQTSSKTRHSHNACNVVSRAVLHRSHGGLLMTIRRHKLSFVGKEFLQAR